MSRIACLSGLLSLWWFAGCAKQPQPAAQPPVTPAVTQTPPQTPSTEGSSTLADMPAEETADFSDSDSESKPSAPETTADTTPAEPAKTIPAGRGTGKTQVQLSLNFVTDDFLAAAVTHPKRILASPLVVGLREEGAFEEVDFEKALGPFSESTGLAADEIEEIAVFISRNMANAVGRDMGLPVEDNPSDQSAAKSPNTYRNNIKMIGLAFHNYHDSFRKFPKAGGPADETDTVKDGLSWRVHLLPFLEQFELYQEFHLDEPWDSEHNKTLIEKMPDIYAVRGVEEAGKTSLHVFTGAGAMFGNNAALGIQHITDGTSNTILCVSAAPDTADIWTKPGGLELDPEKPLACLGELDGKTFLVMMADGAARELSNDIDPRNFANLVGMNDNNIVDLPDTDRLRSSVPFGLYGMSPEQAPVIAITAAFDVDQQEMAANILGDAAEQKTEAGLAYFAADGWGVAFPNNQTVLFAGETLLKKLLSQAETESTAPIAQQLRAADQAFDLLIAADLTSQKALLQALVQQNPLLGPFANVETLTLSGSITGEPGEPLVALRGTAATPQAAQTLAAIVNGLALNQIKEVAAQSSNRPDATEEQMELAKILQPGIEKLEMKAAGKTLTLQLPIPEGFDHVPKLLAPELLKVRLAAKQMERVNRMKQFGLAFHNYHDVFGTFPRAGGQGGTLEEKKQGLSWRVHLLPFLDQAPLYNQFRMDEPWDSAHNKQFIEQMPDIFNVAGVEDAGKTSIHVFTGPGAPFADNAAPRIFDFKDGTSNTLLAVEVGPDTAEIWTKPGGLDFDPEDPFKALGKLGDFFAAVFADGHVRRLPNTFAPEILRNMIQHADGNVVEFEQIGGPPGVP